MVAWFTTSGGGYEEGGYVTSGFKPYVGGEGERIGNADVRRGSGVVRDIVGEWSELKLGVTRITIMIL